MTTLWNDVRYALRQLIKSPGFACATVLILALGIGGVTAMFSTLYTVMIRPLPYRQPDRLVLGRATYNGGVNPWLSGPDYVDYREKCQSFSAVEAFFCRPFEVTAMIGQTADRAEGLPISVGLFPALGVNMCLGRPFTPEEARDGAPPVVIVSHAYWQKHLAARTDIIGSSITIDGTPRNLVGVTPADFHFIHDVDVWFPVRPQNLGPRRFNNWYILARLADGVSLAEAQSDVDVIAAQLEKAYPETNAHKGLLLTPLQGAFTEQYRTSFGVLCAGAAAILLIACANAAGLLLARGAGRQGELAVRAALGASGWRLMRLLLAEALVLAAVSGMLGTILAMGIQSTLLHFLSVETLLLGKVGLSGPVLLFVLAITLTTGVAFGILPAWRARRVDMAQDLRAGGRGSLQHGLRLRGGLVVGQVALSFLLLVAAGLLIRSLTWLHKADAGFDSRNLLTAEVPLPERGYSVKQRVAFFTSLLDGIRSLPGVTSAAVISQLPLRNPYNNIDIYAVAAPPTNPMDSPTANQRAVLPGYFETMGIPLLAGRDIQPPDSESGRAVVISRCLAQALFPDRDPLGQQVIIDRDTRVAWDVVGVVGDVKDNDLREETISRGTFYRAYGRETPLTMRLAIRTTGDSLTVVAPLRALVQKMDSQIPLAGPRTMEEVMANTTVSEKAQTTCLTAFSLLALFLAAIGIYGLLAYIVTERRSDIGIRMAVGAEPAAILTMILRFGIKLVGIGVGFGIVGALALTRILRSQLFGVAPTDVLTFGVVVALLGVVAVVACAIPARRAARIDPLVALRCE
jgi:predicted permease